MHVPWSVEEECADGMPYVNNLGGGGQQNCRNDAMCGQQMMYFRNVVREWPAGSGKRVDLKITLKSFMPGYSIDYNVKHNDNFDAIDPTFGRQGCSKNRKLISIAVFGKTGAFDFEFVRDDGVTPVTLSAFIMGAFDIDCSNGCYDSQGTYAGNPNHDVLSIVRGDGLTRYYVDPATRLRCCQGTQDQCSPAIESLYTHDKCQAMSVGADMQFSGREGIADHSDVPDSIGATSSRHMVLWEHVSSSKSVAVMSGYDETSTRFAFVGTVPCAPPPPPPTCGRKYAQYLGKNPNEVVEVDFESSTTLINNLGGWQSSSLPPVMRYGNVGTLADGTVFDLVIANRTARRTRICLPALTA